jgi:hypothetical protein
VDGSVRRAVKNLDMSAFAEHAAEMVGLAIPAENVEGVRAHLERMREMAKPLMALAIPDDVESAPVFEPGVFEPGVFQS